MSDNTETKTTVKRVDVGEAGAKRTSRTFAGSTLAETVAKLKTESEAAGKASSAPTNAAEQAKTAERRERILEKMTKPKAKTLEAANTALVGAVTQVARNQLEVDTTGVATMAIGLRDVAFYLLTGDKEHPAISPDKGFAAALIRHCRSLPELIKTETFTDEWKQGEKSVQNVVNVKHATLFNVVEGKLTLAAMAAGLLATGDTTKARIGYLSGDKLPSPTKVIESDWLAVAPDQPFFVGICAPYNVIRPEILWQGAIGGDVMRVPNRATGLKYMTHEMIRGMYGHYFGGDPLAFDNETGVGKKPTGLLTMWRKPRVAASGTGAPTLETELTKALSDVDKTLIALGAKMALPMPRWEVPSPKTTAGLIAALCEAMVTGLVAHGELNTKTFAESPCAATLVLLRNRLCACIGDEDKTTGNHRTINSDGKPAYVIGDNPVELASESAQAAVA